MGGERTSAAEVVRAGYDQLAERYQKWAAQSDGDSRGGWMERLARSLQAGVPVLDFGCGPGVPTARWLSERFDVTGVDISEAQLKLARAAVPRARFLHADMNEVEFDPGSFHAVVALYSLIHLPQSVLPGVLDRVRSWLVPDGHLLVTLGTVPGEGLQDDWLGVPMFFGGMAPEDNRSALETAGFEIVGEQLETAVEQGEGEVTFHWLLAKSAASRPTAPDPSR